MKIKKLTYDNKLPRESEVSFQKFLLYRDLSPHERSVRKVAEQIAENPQEIEKKYIALKKLCTHWQWVERCKLYDADQQLKLVRKRADKFDEFNGMMLDNVDGLIRYANDLLGEVIRNPVKDNGENYSLASRIKMANDVSKLLKESNELACNLTGRPSVYKELNVNADVSEQTVDLFEQMKQKRKELKKEEKGE